MKDNSSLAIRLVPSIWFISACCRRRKANHIVSDKWFVKTLQRIPLRYRLTCDAFTAPIWLISLYLRWCNLRRRAKWFIVWSTDFFCHSIKVDIRIKWPAAHYGLFMDFLSLIIVAHHISLLIRDLFGYQFSQFRFIVRGDVSYMRE